MRKGWIALFVLFLFVSSAPHVAAAVPCESLASLSLPNTTITAAETIAAGAYEPTTGRPEQFENMPAFCRVAATLTPGPTSDVKMEVWMPVEGWNGKFQGRGTNGMGGSIPLGGMAAILRNGYATGGTDTGHTGNSSYAMSDADKIVDFAYRAMHEMTVKAKAIIPAYYERDIELSFMDGCGTAAFAAMTELQHYPEDYDAYVLTGIPYKTRHSLWQLWIWQVVHENEASYISEEEFAFIHEAVLDQFDEVDGVRDRRIEDPRGLEFDPTTIQCRGADGEPCLTEGQVEALRKIYAGPTNPRTGEAIYYPPRVGSETRWNTLTRDEPLGLAVEWLRYYVFEDPNWDPMTFNWDSDMALTDTPQNILLNSPNPNIEGFINRGGKLLMYPGWSDARMYGFDVDYYEQMVERVGPGLARDSVRMFMVPGLTHCGDASEFDMVGELLEWVETDQAPDQIIGSRIRDGREVGTRLLCPYPQAATYQGSGSADDAANYMCQAPR